MTNLSVGTTSPDMDWEERRRPLIGRIAGLLLVVGMLLGFIPIPGYHSLYYSNPSTPQIVDWATHNGSAIVASHFLFAWQATLWGIAFVLLISVLRGRGLLAALTYVGAGSYIALNWALSGAGTAFAEAARQTGSDAGVIALFNLAKTSTDGVSFALAVASLSVLVLLTRRLPGVIGWFGLVVALAFFVGGPVDLVVEGTTQGVIGPISTILVIVWIIGTGLLLLIRPVWGGSSKPLSAPASPVMPPASHEGV
jgi:hypothetical protein